MEHHVTPLAAQGDVSRTKKDRDAPGVQKQIEKCPVPFQDNRGPRTTRGRSANFPETRYMPAPQEATRGVLSPTG